MRSRTIVVLLAAFTILLPATPAAAVVGDIATVDVNPLIPLDGATGPDGNLWFATDGPEILRVTTDRGIAVYQHPDASVLHSVAAGADNRMWFTDGGAQQLLVIDPLADNPHNAMQVMDGDDGGPGPEDDEVAGPEGITGGPDGNIWWVNSTNDTIGRLNPSAPDPDATIETFADPDGQVDHPFGITSASDGNLWFTMFTQSRIGRIDPDAADPAASITTFTDPDFTNSGIGIASGSDGNVWFVAGDLMRLDPATGAMTPITNLDNEIAVPWGITQGPDGNLWISSGANDRIVRSTNNGVLAAFSDPDTEVDNPTGITDGPDDRVWFASTSSHKVGRIDAAVFDHHDFSDVEDGIFYERALNWAKAVGLVTGFPDGTYRPKDPVNRGQVVNMLWHLMDEPTATTPHGFPDVPAGAFYDDALDWAKEEGLVTGFPDGTYRPKESVNRGQIANMVFHMVGEPTGSPGSGFPDIPNGAFYIDGVDFVKHERLVTGFPNGTYRPKNAVNRGQVANILYQLASGPHAWRDVDDPPTTVLF